MSDNSAIEWTDATWNPTTGCTQVSPGCDHCYALTLSERFRGVPGHYFENGFDVQLRPSKLDQPLRWKRPRKVFVNSMSDLFHDAISDDYIAQVFAVMAAAPQHVFQLLTKRHGRMRSLLSSVRFDALLLHHVRRLADERGIDVRAPRPLPNLWLGVSVENQQWANIRIPALLDTPAAVRFLSCEPLLGPISLFANTKIDTGTLVDWVIVGGESGHGARPMRPAWARGLRDECNRYDIPFLFKQWGEWTPRYPAHLASFSGAYDEEHQVWRVGKHAAGRELDGRTWDEYPEAAR